MAAAWSAPVCTGAAAHAGDTAALCDDALNVVLSLADSEKLMNARRACRSLYDLSERHLLTAIKRTLFTTSASADHTLPSLILYLSNVSDGVGLRQALQSVTVHQVAFLYNRITARSSPPGSSPTWSTCCTTPATTTTTAVS